MDLGLAGKVAIIAGASRGIGRATALILADEHCRLALVARGEEALLQTAKEVEKKGAEALAVTCELTVAADAERLVHPATERFGRIDTPANSPPFSPPRDDPNA